MQFEQLNQQSYEATLERWTWEADANDVFPHEVERRLRWIGELLSNGKGDANYRSLAYGVFTVGSEVPAAVCELVISRKTMNERWLKLLSVILSPEVEAKVEAGDVDAIQTAVMAYRTAVSGAFDAQLEHNADTLKLYGRNEAMLKLLTTLLATLQSSGSDFDAKKEGRWLVLRSIPTTT
ncbi:MAG: hypothetical protein WA129_05385 [Acidovorax sp.]